MTWSQTATQLARWRQSTPEERDAVIEQMEQLPPPDAEALAAILPAISAEYRKDDAPQSEARNRHDRVAWERMLVTFAQQLAGVRELEAFRAERAAAPMSEELAPLLAELGKKYRELGANHPRRHELLELLAMLGTRASLAEFAELVATDPPASHEAALAFAPLFRNELPASEVLFPRLLDAMEHESAATLVLDLANHLYRRRTVSAHPARPRAKTLAALFGQIVSRMQVIEEKPAQFAKTPAELSLLVAKTVGLAIALADTLGLIGDVSVEAKLRQALGVGHRRLRAEAAAALGRLKIDEGFDVLATLAADPGSRTRALAYLEELGQLEKAPEALRTSQARAEGELAAWLAQPTRFGLPPTGLDLVDTRVQKWPGYEEPQECFLIRYLYEFPRGTLRGIGIAGPVTHSLSVDLEDISPSDIYAAYCGWHVEHEEIRLTPVDELPPEALKQWEPLEENLRLAGYEELRLAYVGEFFGELLPVYTAKHSGQPGVLLTEGDERHWRPALSSPRPFGPQEVFYLHVGRKILKTFNDEAESL